MNSNRLNRLGWRAGAVLTVSLGLAACAGDVPPPTAELGAASQAVLAAEQAGAPRFAPVELQSARDKLAAADTAMREDKRTEARRLAEQARADAELAAARSQRALTQEAAGVVRQQANPPQAAAPAAPSTPGYGSSGGTAGTLGTLPSGSSYAAPSTVPPTTLAPGGAGWGGGYSNPEIRP
ncbi:DUF4398 domain-containing protein [Azospirillum thermophilum]|uniref:DUF4398 domain-containing protein n=1 Tax=Azospirillum thermophilum TaxID=2202148 RepID=UPI00143DB4D7|nr:DUF4398 domain-containing protein [Azospirillum thermophilum]